MGALERILPDELKKGAFVSGSELVLPYVEALSAILVATKHQVALLGLDAFEVREVPHRQVLVSWVIGN